MVGEAAVFYSALAMPDLTTRPKSETVTTWEFAQGGRVLACQHIENSGGTHTILVTENGEIIERHEFQEDPASPAENARRLNEVRYALRGIYQRRFAAGSSSRRK
jgi:hypothetical protein